MSKRKSRSTKEEHDETSVHDQYIQPKKRARGKTTRAKKLSFTDQNVMDNSSMKK